MNAFLHETGARRAGPARAAFTLIELVVVMAILGALIALLAPTLAAARKQALQTQCLSNLRQIGVAMQAYTHDYHDHFPIAQYVDLHRGALVAWDTITYWSDLDHARPGLIWEYVAGEAVRQCPAHDGPSMTSGDPYTGYNYNTTYLGRGQNEGPHQNMGESPAQFSQVRAPGRAALVGDGGWASGANKFMRAPLDEGVSEGTVHAGAQAFRHRRRTLVTYVDGHGDSVLTPHRKPGASRESEQLLDWPSNGFLSSDDSAYSRF